MDVEWWLQLNDLFVCDSHCVKKKKKRVMMRWFDHSLRLYYPEVIILSFFSVFAETE